MNGDRVLGSNEDASTYSCAKVLLPKRCSGRSVALRIEEVRQQSPASPSSHRQTRPCLTLDQSVLVLVQVRQLIKFLQKTVKQKGLARTLDLFTLRNTTNADASKEKGHKIRAAS
jgi:hypothetical protein